MIRSAKSAAWCTPSMSSHSTTNSSPPRRATVSVSRTALWMRIDASMSSWSPTVCPSVSFTDLKRSRSTNSTREHALAPPNPGQRLFEPVGEHHAVRQARQRIVEHLVRQLRLEALLVGEVADDPRDRRRRTVDRDRAGRHDHRETASVLANPGGLDLTSLHGVLADRQVLLEELPERLVQLVDHDHRHGPADDLVGAVSRTSTSAAALNEPTVPSGNDGEDSFGRVLDHRAVVGFAPAARRRGRARPAWSDRRAGARRVPCSSPIAPAIRIAIANTNAPRPPIVCACDPLRNDGAQPTNTNTWPMTHPVSDHPSAARHARRAASAEDPRARRTRTPCRARVPSRSCRRPT